MTTREHEQTLNVRLSDELRARSLDAKPEVTHLGNRRIDVEVRVGPAVSRWKREHGQSSGKRRDAIADADKRLPNSENLADVAIAVCYPDDTTSESLPAAELIWTIRLGDNESSLHSGQSASRPV